MVKNYTNESGAIKLPKKSPKKSVLDSILNFSKSLEIHQTDSKKGEGSKTVEIILN